MDQDVERIVRASAERLGAVYPSPKAYLDLVRGLGTIQPWSESWDAYFLYDLAEAEEGGVRPRTSRTAVLEDLAYGIGRDATELWPNLTMPVLLLRATRPMHPELGGHVIAPELFERFRTEVPDAVSVEVPTNHYDILSDPDVLDRIVRFLSA